MVEGERGSEVGGNEGGKRRAWNGGTKEEGIAIALIFLVVWRKM
jgi:hypothetical protein